MSLPSTDRIRRAPARAWPVLAAGATGLAVIVVLALTEQAHPLIGLIGALVIATTTALCVFAADRARQARGEELQAETTARAAPSLPLEEIVDALPDPILVVSAAAADNVSSRRFNYANRAASRLLQLSQREGLLINVIRDPEVLEAIDQALFGEREAECLYETAGVQPLTLRAHVRPMGEAEGRRLAVLVFRDETEMRQVEQTRADFLANASHELRTPLASLAGFIETLRGHAKDDVAVRDRFLSIMQAQAARMSRLVDDLMSLSRIELAEHIRPADPVDLVGCVSDVAEALAPLAERREVSLKVRSPRKGATTVAGDRDQILQVIQNVAHNALKYSPDGKPIDIVVQTGLSLEAASAPFRPGAARLALLSPDQLAGSYAAIRISDRGLGIEREHLPRLTERFYRVEGQKSGERAGSGLGLAIVKHIVNRHRGGMTVESALGEGTTFTVYLPLLAVPAEEIAPDPLGGDVAKVS